MVDALSSGAMVFIRWRVPTIIAALIALTLATSLVAAIDARSGGSLYLALALVPAQVWHGQVWRLVTWPLVEGDPWALVFACVTLYWFGGDLVSAWGGRRFARYVAAIVVLAGCGTSVLALVVRLAWHRPHLGGWALGDALVIAWALQFPERRVRIHGLLVVGGELLAYGTFGFVLLCAAFFGLAPFLPELLAGAGALVYITGTLDRITGALAGWRAAVTRRYQRRHLHVVPDDGHRPN